MRPNLVVEMAEFDQGFPQGQCRRRFHLAQYRLQSPKQALNAPVAPGLARRSTAVDDAQLFKGKTPELAGEHAFVVGSDGAGQAELCDGQEHIRQQGERAFSGQGFQAQKAA